MKAKDFCPFFNRLIKPTKGVKGVIFLTHLWKSLMELASLGPRGKKETFFDVNMHWRIPLVQNISFGQNFGGRRVRRGLISFHTCGWANKKVLWSFDSEFFSTSNICTFESFLHLTTNISKNIMKRFTKKATRQKMKICPEQKILSTKTPTLKFLFKFKGSAYDIICPMFLPSLDCLTCFCGGSDWDVADCKLQSVDFGKPYPRSRTPRQTTWRNRPSPTMHSWKISWAGSPLGTWAGDPKLHPTAPFFQTAPCSL